MNFALPITLTARLFVLALLAALLPIPASAQQDGLSALPHPPGTYIVDITILPNPKNGSHPFLTPPGLSKSQVEQLAAQQALLIRAIMEGVIPTDAVAKDFEARSAGLGGLGGTVTLAAGPDGKPLMKDGKPVLVLSDPSTLPKGVWDGDAYSIDFSKLGNAITTHQLSPAQSDSMLAEYDEAVRLRNEGKYVEAIPHADRAVRLAETQYGINHVAYAIALGTSAELYFLQKDATTSEPLLRSAIAAFERARNGENAKIVDPWLLRPVRELASLYRDRAQYRAAEALLRNGVQIAERAYGRENLEMATSCYLLGDNLALQERFSEAKPYLESAIAIWQKNPTGSGENFGGAFAAVGWVYQKLRLLPQAEAAYLKAIQIREKEYRPNAALIAQDLINLGGLYSEQEEYSKATPALLKALEMRTKSGHGNDASTAPLLFSISASFEHLARFEEAAEYSERATNLDAEAKADPTAAFGTNNAFVAESIRKVAELYEKAGNVPKFYELSRRAVHTYVRYLRQRPELRKRFRGAAGGLNVLDNDAIVMTAIRAAWLFGSQGKSINAFAAESLETAQWRNESFVSDALTLAEARSFATTQQTGELIRQWEDMREKQRQKLADVDRNEAALQFLTLDDQMSRLIGEINRDVPNFFRLIYPQPLSVTDIQVLLGPSAALAVFMADEECAYVWIITQQQVAWNRIPLGSDALAQKVAAFRRGLDVDEISKEIKESKNPDLFDLGLANELYATLFGHIEPLIKDKRQLLIVPSGALTALPFHLLVTERPIAPKPDKMSGYRDAAWLIKRHAVAVLPSVASLKALRVFASKERAAKPMVGFGDPVFDPNTPAVNLTHTSTKTAARSLTSRSYADFWLGTGLDRAKLTRLSALPDTADELKAVAKDLGAPASDIHLGKDASETTVKQLPLADYRIVYFATHALVAGDIKGLGEPALALSIPVQPTEIDDGLLTASEVAQLKLNADWVVLSACNTVAGDKPGAEALSGLARAFFYAGARALLVSHWAVATDAAARLTTSTFAILKANTGIGRAEALRRAELAYLNDTSDPRNAYPAFWGPFEIVGDGGAR